MSSAEVEAVAEPTEARPLSLPKLLSIIIPTYNESANIPVLIGRLDAALHGCCAYEIIVVDDDSPDRTWEVVERIGANDARVRVVRRLHERGLSSAVVAGFCCARGDALAVIDADLQHDETILPRIAEALAETEVVVASRYIPGGGTGDWSKQRRFMSRFATRLSQWLLRVQVKDPMSGFFALRREVFDRVADRLNPKGFKILLEILYHSGVSRVVEVPYTFRIRLHGESKLDAKVKWQFLCALYDLRFGRVLPRSFLLYGAVGLSGVGINLGVLSLLHRMLAVPERAALIAGIAVAMLSNFLLNNRFTFRRQMSWKSGVLAKRFIGFIVVCSLGARINFAVAELIRHRLALPVEVADLAGIVVATIWNYLISAHYVWNDGVMRRLSIGWLAVCAVLATMLFAPRLSSPGCYVDGNLYALISRNLAAGLGTWSAPHGSPYCHDAFFEHPPLALIANAGFFAVFGDHWWTEKLFMAAIFLATAMAIGGIWRTSHPLRGWLWVPILLWSALPRTPWLFGNNMLEAPLLLCCAVAIWALERARAGTPRAVAGWCAAAAVATVLSVLVKGPFGLFTLVAPGLMALAEGRARGRALVVTVVHGAMAGALFGLCLLNQDLRSNLAQYYEQQFAASLSGGRGADMGGRAKFLPSLFEHLAPLLAVAGLAWWRLRSVDAGALWRRSLGWLLVGLSASLPILVTNRFATHYLGPSLAFFALAAALPVAAALRTGELTTAGRWALATVFSSAIAVGISWGLAHLGTVRREADVFALCDRLRVLVPAKAAIGFTASQKPPWPLIHYLYRWNWQALDTLAATRATQPWQIYDPKVDLLPAGYVKVDDLPTGLALAQRSADRSP